MTVAFNEISATIYTPGVFAEFDPSQAVQGVSLLPHVTLITGQMLTAAATAGQVYLVDSDAEAVTLFGAKSQIRQMIRAYKRKDPLTSVYAVALADAVGTQATGDFAFGGTATEAKEVALYIGGVRVPFSVAVGDDGAAMETAALAALALYDDDLPVTYAGSAGSGVDLTASHDGTLGNQIYIGHSLLPGERLPAGVTVTPTAMSGGATDPDYSAVITSMAEDQYHSVVSGLATDTVLDLFEAELESRWGPMRAIEGVVFAALYDTAANLTTAGNARNSHTSVHVGAEESALLPLPWELAAQSAAISAIQAKADPSRAMTGIAYSGFSAAPRGARFTRAQRDVLLSDGVSTVKDASDGRLLVERFVTTYQTNANSLPDTAYQDLTTVRLLAAIRYSVRVRISTRFARFKLTDDGNRIPPGQPIVSPAIIRAELIALFLDWQDLGWVENVDAFKEQLVVERDGSDPNRVNIILPPDLINNLLVTALRIPFKR